MEHDAGFDRRAPYAPISALREFFQRIKDMAEPSKVDRRFLQKLNVASNNEWALLSALKFLEVIDAQGSPTPAYRLLQTTDQFQSTLHQLVTGAYRELVDMGGPTMSTEDLTNYFRVSSSPSQAKNAARFFREVCELAGMTPGPIGSRRPSVMLMPSRAPSDFESIDPSRNAPDVPSKGGQETLLLEIKGTLLEKLPVYREEWSVAVYMSLCDRFLQMLHNLDPNGTP